MDHNQQAQLPAVFEDEKSELPGQGLTTLRGKQSKGTLYKTPCKKRASAFT